ncbi:MAG: glucose-6-phosphate isomerase [Spirochaetia bacterium]|nr:glucose-6-phosphate isomerase [Spirochaetia bacterium]
MNYFGLTETEAFKKLCAYYKGKPSLKELLTPEAVRKYVAPAGRNLSFSYAGKGITPQLVQLCQSLADEQECIAKYRSLLAGGIANKGENRAVLHHLCRGTADLPVSEKTADNAAFYESQKEQFFAFADKVRSGAIKSSTGKVFDTLVQIGIGGSGLGPKALYKGLLGYCRAENIAPILKAEFISNIDPDEPASVLSRINPETTLFILVTKSGTTLETLTNYTFAEEYIQKKCPAVSLSKQTVAVTAAGSPLDDGKQFLAVFHIDDFVGGRFSSTSACAGVLVSAAFGKDIFGQFLSGAHYSDILALNEKVEENAALMDALLEVIDVNIRHIPVEAVIPYSAPLADFTAHLQQLYMESNGKPAPYATCPVLFTAVGTDCQHSFFQQLHQGKVEMPMEFIGFRHSQAGADIQYKGSSSQAKLNANLAAQITAFADGRSNADINKCFPGNRATSLLYGDRLTPENLGSLFAHFENKVMFQGFLWNINSYDQEGVKLGKELAASALDMQADNPILDSYYSLF